MSSGSIPVVDLALEQINNRTDILSNYTLNYTTILDSNVSSYIISAFTVVKRIESQYMYIDSYCMHVTELQSIDGMTMMHYYRETGIFI